ncbi:MAG: ECF transporter S component [Firmicutes bacterium]|nr:ECF transporter S component [Bacillota bacterium]
MKIKTKNLVITSLLSAIAIIIPLLGLLKVSIPPFSATFASHVPLILAMLISPFSAVFAAIVSAAGFLITYTPVVAARASVHIFFLIAGSYMVKKKVNIYVVGAVTMVIHALSEVLIVYALYRLGDQTILKDKEMNLVAYIISIGTSLHHIVDFTIAMIIYIPLSNVYKDTFMPVWWGKKKEAAETAAK